MSMVAIVDYGVGNLFSVRSSLRYIGEEAVIAADAAAIRRAERIVLPGVGAFSDAAEKLRTSGLADVVREAAEKGTPLLGICLGMQMLFESSEEGGNVDGLGVFSGHVLRFSPDMGLKIPQIGWNNLTEVRHPDLRKNDYVYFVHSYYCAPSCQEDIAATTEYGIPYASAVARENVLATQFHPEKSGEVGLAILNRWARRTR